MARILITGVSGLLGANLAIAAHARQHNVVGLYGQHPVVFDGITTTPIDLTDSIAVTQCLDTHMPDWVIHCAALTNVDWCEQHRRQTRQLHVEATRHLSMAAGQHGIRLAYISTDAVYGGKRDISSENDSTEPINYYAYTKLEGERVVQHHLPDALIARTVMYGWNCQPKQCLAEWMLANLETATPFDGYDDTRFSPILVNDLAEILLTTMEHGISGLYNMGGGEACSKYEFALRLAEVFGLNRELIRRTNMTDAAFHARRPHNTAMTMDKLYRTLKVSLPDVVSGLARFKALRDTGFVDALKKHYVASP